MISGFSQKGGEIMTDKQTVAIPGDFEQCQNCMSRDVDCPVCALHDTVTVDKADK